MEEQLGQGDNPSLQQQKRPATPEVPASYRARTPPTISSRHVPRNSISGRSETSNLESEAMQRMMEGSGAGKQRERTPGRSPSRKRQRTYGDRTYGDRFIPNRDGQDLQATYSLLHDDGSPATPSRSKKKAPHAELHFQKTEEANQTYSQVLRNELMGDSVPQSNRSISPDALYGSRHTPPVQSGANLPPATLTPTTPHRNMFSYMSSPKKLGSGHPTPSSKKTGITPGIINLNARSDLYSVSPLNYSSHAILQTPKKQPRPVSKVPYKVLDAPELADDFYLNLVDWGSANILGVGLGSCVYMWNSSSGKVTQLCKLPDNDLVTSVAWIQRGSHLAIGTHKGFVQIYDAEKQRRLRTMTGHTARVGALAWNDHILTSGSRDRNIYHRDVRSPDQYLRKLSGHKQEVCGLRWNTEDGQLASGGNDNKLFVWDKLAENPLHRFNNHVAAVKAIAWSPHQHHLLASGGGTADRSIKFWDTAKGELIKEIETGSQVCNLAWSKNSDEIVSTHGYSQNQISVWKYPKMEQVVSLTGHTYRVLYLSASPDGTTVVTGAGDETLRFWKVFGKKGGDKVGASSAGLSLTSGKFSDWGSIR
jgi:cell division cycle 20-like protein 1, cofactor of APC complex